jgi:hypothetical protein
MMSGKRFGLQTRLILLLSHQSFPHAFPLVLGAIHHLEWQYLPPFSLKYLFFQSTEHNILVLW